jgi:adenosylcobinamide kinase/adenosylcobinamide-phosphate guanylyltransferase
LVIGGCRSGKSSHALHLAEKMRGDEKIFVATCVPRDDEMRQRVANHQKQRSQKWKTVEAPLRLPEAIGENAKTGSVVLVDCLTMWVSNLLMENGDDPGIADVLRIEAQIPGLVHAIDPADGPVILVSNEVGAGIVPENKLARRFRDLVGSLNQAVAKRADSVVWMVAGIPVSVKE